MRRHRQIRCHICDEPIDRGACGESWGVLTINDDRASRGADGAFERRRIYLCGDHADGLEWWLAERRREYTGIGFERSTLAKMQAAGIRPPRE